VKPAHYTEGRKYEPWDVILDWGVSYCVGSAIKYLSRAGRKDDAVQDLRKAIAFIEREIQRLENP
jgi:phage gp36-like protein